MNERASSAGYRSERIDQRILYELMAEARDKTSPVIAERIGVSPGTVRSHVEDLEEHGVIPGYPAHIDFERTDGQLSPLFSDGGVSDETIRAFVEPRREGIQ